VVMTVPAKMVVTDTEAIALYVAAGNPREDWAALDDRDRWPWRKMALEEVADPVIHGSPAARQQRPLSRELLAHQVQEQGAAAVCSRHVISKSLK
jgi:glutathione S-transferase